MKGYVERGRMGVGVGVGVVVGAHSSSGKPAASFQWHRDAITSIEWHPTDSSVLAASGADDQLTIWDFSVEQDTEEDMNDGDTLEVPPQLLFIHQVPSSVWDVL